MPNMFWRGGGRWKALRRPTPPCGPVSKSRCVRGGSRRQPVSPARRRMPRRLDAAAPRASLPFRHPLPVPACVRVPLPVASGQPAPTLPQPQPGVQITASAPSRRHSESCWGEPRASGRPTAPAARFLPQDWLLDRTRGRGEPTGGLGSSRHAPRAPTTTSGAGRGGLRGGGPRGAAGATTAMSELSDEASEPEFLNRSLSMWHGLGTQVSREELDVPLDLHTAASIGQYEVVKECVQRRELDLNKKNGGGWTPLMYASYIGHDTIVHLLLEAGVSVNVPTPEGQTPLMLASSCGNESIAYFLLQQGAELEMKDIHGWTALFHCTSAGHQQMVKFLLDSGANANVREPIYGFTPLMEAAAAGHEIIVQYFLNHGVRVDTRDHSGATARMLAKQYGHMKIVALIDTHSPALPKNLYRSPEKYEDLSSSDESYPVAQRQRPYRKKGLSIHEGPRALARITAIGLGGEAPQPHCEQVPPRGYMTFTSSDENPLEGEGLCYRDVTSPINEQDVESSSSSSREEPAFCASLGAVRSSSSEGLARAQGLSSEASLESNEDSDHVRKSSVRRQTKSYVKTKNRYSTSDGQWPPSSGTCGAACSPRFVPQAERSSYTGPQDLAALLEQIGCLKYLQVFEEQDVDLRIFLTLTESDLKEIGITLFGPKRKMTSAIARWHSSARPPSDALELAYADRLEAEMQELAIQLHKRCEEVEAMRGQVSQEQELRAVVESCLLEQDGARKNVHTQLQETWALAQGATLVLEQLRACQAELSARVRQDQPYSATTLGPHHPLADSKGWHASLQAMSLPELSGALEDCVHEMGRALCSVTQSLEKLQVLNGKEKWREP